MSSPVEDHGTDKKDLWFLRDDTVVPENDLPPLPRADTRPLFDPDNWQQAEAHHRLALADATAALTRLDERAQHAPRGILQRLAVHEAAALSWANGQPMTGDTLALYLAERRGGGDMAQALEHAAWAVRRLTGPWPFADLTEFLGLYGPARPNQDVKSIRAHGEDFDALQHELAQLISAELHPLTRAALAYSFWRASELSPDENLLEPAVYCARLATSELELPFAPLATGAAKALMFAGTAQERLGYWLEAVQEAATAAALILRHLMIWNEKTRDATQDLSGRTPPALIAILLRETVVSAPGLAKAAGVTAMTARRNLDLFSQRELIREISGQTRYRFWTAV